METLGRGRFVLAEEFLTKLSAEPLTFCCERDGFFLAGLRIEQFFFSQSIEEVESKVSPGLKVRVDFFLLEGLKPE